MISMRRTTISEKTLELNINENILSLIRQRQGFARAFLHGFTLRHEALVGLDSSINVSPHSSFYMAFQYKKPVLYDSINGIYKFEVNNNKSRNQHLHLIACALLFESIYGIKHIFYAFPPIGDMNHLYSLSPNFLGETFFVYPPTIPFIDRHVHTVTINVNANTITVNSPRDSPHEVTEFYRGKEILTVPEKPIRVRTLEDLKRMDVSDISRKILQLAEKYGIDQKALSEVLSQSWRIQVRNAFFI